MKSKAPTEWLETARDRLAKVSPGPWKADGETVDPVYCDCCSTRVPEGVENAAFIASARNEMGWLLDRMEEARGLIQSEHAGDNYDSEEAWLAKVKQGPPALTATTLTNSPPSPA